jgi:hypothetical protein
MRDMLVAGGAMEGHYGTVIGVEHEFALEDVIGIVAFAPPFEALGCA